MALSCISVQSEDRLCTSRNIVFPQTDSLLLSDEEDTDSESEQVTKHGERSSMYDCFSNNLGYDLSSKLKLKIESLVFINCIDLLDSEERGEAHQSSDLKGISS